MQTSNAQPTRKNEQPSNHQHRYVFRPPSYIFRHRTSHGKNNHGDPKLALLYIICLLPTQVHPYHYVIWLGPQWHEESKLLLSLQSEQIIPQKEHRVWHKISSEWAISSYPIPSVRNLTPSPKYKKSIPQTCAPACKKSAQGAQFAHFPKFAEQTN